MASRAMKDAARTVPPSDSGGASSSAGPSRAKDLTPQQLKRIEEHFSQQVLTPFEAIPRGKVPRYVQEALERMRHPGGSGSFTRWQQEQKAFLEQVLSEEHDAQIAFAARVLREDPDIAPGCSKIQLPFMLRLMRQMGVSQTTLRFIEKGFSSGFRYVGEVPLTGLYAGVAPEKSLGKFEEVPLSNLQRPARRRRGRKPDFSSQNLRVPKEYLKEIYEATKKELEIDKEGKESLPFAQYLGPFHSPEDLPGPLYHPAFRFWVVQDTSHGGDPGRVVDDLTASGANCRSPIHEKLWLPTLDDFLETVRLIETLFPGDGAGIPQFWKQDMLKAFRQIPGDAHSRKFGSFAVKNPSTGKLEFLTHLGLPFGARASPMIFCSVALIICKLAAHFLGIPVMAFVDDFFSVSPGRYAQQNFDLFKWFIKLLGFSLKEKKETPPTRDDDLLGVRVVLRAGGTGYFTLPQSKRDKYSRKIKRALDANFLAPGDAAKLAGGLTFASCVALARFGRAFLQPLYAAASCKFIPPEGPEFSVEDWVLRPQGAALPDRLKKALEWWLRLLEHFPDRKFRWGLRDERPLFDVYTDASAEGRWEGLGGVAFYGSVQRARTVRTLTPKELESLLPPLFSQKVRISQLELLAVLLTLHVLGDSLRDSFTRFHIDNLAAMYALINCYSGNAFMARLAGEIWMLLLEYNITPYFDWVASEDNVSDIFSRPDLERVGARLSERYSWSSVDPKPRLAALQARFRRSPNTAWTHLWTHLYGGART